MSPGSAHESLAIDDELYADRLEVEIAPARLRHAVNERPVRHEVGDPVEQRRVRITSKPRIDDLDCRQRRDGGRDFAAIVFALARGQIAVEPEGNFRFDPEQWDDCRRYSVAAAIRPRAEE